MTRGNATPLSDGEMALLRHCIENDNGNGMECRLLSTIDQMRLTARLERERGGAQCAHLAKRVMQLEALLTEAADSVHASLAEADITEARREYRAGLEARLRAAIGGVP